MCRLPASAIPSPASSVSSVSSTVDKAPKSNTGQSQQPQWIWWIAEDIATGIFLLGNLVLNESAPQDSNLDVPGRNFTLLVAIALKQVLKFVYYYSVLFAESPGKSNTKHVPKVVRGGKASEETPSSPYWIIHEQEYDLGDFVERHPGGKEAILLGKGRDCTALFESYHPPFEDSQEQSLPRMLLRKYAVRSMPLPKGSHKVKTDPDAGATPDAKDPFYSLLSKRVADRLREVGVDPRRQKAAPPRRVVYYSVIFGLWIATGYLYISGRATNLFSNNIISSLVQVFLVPLAFSVAGWLMGALGHDAGHFSAFAYAPLNEWAVWAMSCIENPILWQHQHTYAHHSFTNDFHKDPDLHHFDLFLRVHERFPFQSIYKQQRHFIPYVLLSYAFVVFGTCFWIPWGMIQSGSLYGIVDWHDRNRWTKAWGMRLHWVLYIALILWTPLITYPHWVLGLIAVSVHVSAMGIIFALFSQINHLNEYAITAATKTERPQVGGKGFHMDLNTSWAVSQIETSNNFATSSALWFYLSNGLNLQIEHHLFPGLNHVHLHHIAPVVRETCREYGVDYRSYESWSDVLSATRKWLSRLSYGDNEQSEVEVKRSE